ncbi:hypothetical protein H6P81_018432 [Aristolochia fimbriata]|uniref:BRISC and BRCA1-A complex member 2 n=1 Tax=Aristolochia fimbriata TaxID=158543 RepID=A0AAV7E5B9_ARIFI|nr:hypothetical protein H6P81_018432 [Aristolochia fimbriata]
MSIDNLPPLVTAQLEYLLAHSPLTVKVDQIWSGCQNSLYSDRFSLLIPFCLDYVKWDVIYNAQYPLAAPDITFAPEDDDFHPLLMIDYGEGGNKTSKSSLFAWNSKDPTKLMTLIHELRDLYMAFQRKRVEEFDDARLKFEINTVLSREGIEVCLLSGPEKQQEVKFSVPVLDMNLNKLVHACPWRRQQKINLQAVFPVSRNYLNPPPPRVKLVASSELKALFSVDDVKLPSWVDGMCMAEYLPALEDNLGAQILEAVASLGARRRFIEALAPYFGRPLEADPIFCRTATVLAISGVFTFLVHFFLPVQFPKQQPVLMLQSSQHFNGQLTPRMSPPLTDYPWSPRWDAPMMVERIRDFIVEECLNFKKFCNDAIL